MIHFNFLWQAIPHTSEDGVKASHTHTRITLLPNHIESLLSVADLQLYHVCHVSCVHSSWTCKRDTWNYLVPRSYLKSSDNCVPGSFEVPGFCHFRNLLVDFSSYPPHHPTHLFVKLQTSLSSFHLHLHISAEILMSFWQCNIWVLTKNTNIFWETYWTSLFSAWNHIDHRVTKVKGHLWTISAVFHHK